MAEINESKICDFCSLHTKNSHPRCETDQICEGCGHYFLDLCNKYDIQKYGPWKRCKKCNKISCSFCTKEKTCKCGTPINLKEDHEQPSDNENYSEIEEDSQEKLIKRKFSEKSCSDDEIEEEQQPVIKRKKGSEYFTNISANLIKSNIEDEIKNIVKNEEFSFNNPIVMVKMGNSDTKNLKFTVSITLPVYKSNGTMESTEETNFKKNCGKYGLKPEHFGKTFQSSNGNFTITGINQKNKKYPILATQLGKNYKFSKETSFNFL